MKENGVIRRRLSGKEADPYIGQARKILGEMKNIMQMGGIKQLSWTKDLQNGVRIMVSSIFGQDEVRIFVPVIEVSTKEKIKNVYDKRTEDIVYLLDFNNNLAMWDGGKVNTVTPEVPDFNYIYGISGDGSTVVGQGLADTDYSLIYWTANGGVVNTGVPISSYNPNYMYMHRIGVSEDGSKIASSYDNYSDAYIYTKGKGAVSLGIGLSPDGDGAIVSGMSADGTKVVGNWVSSINALDYYKGASPSGWMWNNGVITYFTDLVPLAISGDGRTVVGSSMPHDPALFWPEIPHNAMIWTEAGGEKVIKYDEAAISGNGTGTGTSVCTAVNYDGTVIAGAYTTEDFYTRTKITPFVYTSNGITDLSDGSVELGGYYWYNLVSTIRADGDVMYGSGQASKGSDAYNPYMYSLSGNKDLNPDPSPSAAFYTVAYIAWGLDVGTRYYKNGIQIDKAQYDSKEFT